MARRPVLWAGLPAVLLTLQATGRAEEARQGPAEALSAARGAALYEGREPLVGMIRGSERPMPPEVLACGGCHKPQAAGRSDVPVLDATNLETSTSRRYGPPSAYTQETFCRAIRTGIDPVHILMSRGMPVFAVSPQQCESLWLYVTQGEAPR